jgi:hypothetical protein
VELLPFCSKEEICFSGVKSSCVLRLLLEGGPQFGVGAVVDAVHNVEVVVVAVGVSVGVDFLDALAAGLVGLDLSLAVISEAVTVKLGLGVDDLRHR